jgi:hypothetical protein
MKIRVVLLLFVAGAMSLVLSSYKNGAAARLGWDGTGATGTTGCTNGGGCHNAVTTAATTVELDSAGIPVSSYQPGGAYTVKISATCGTAGVLLPLAAFGFQLATVTASGGGTTAATQLGTWGALPANVRSTPGSGRTAFPIIEQSAAITATTGTGALGTIYSESIPWTAPAHGSGAVEIFGIINEATGLDINSFCNYQTATPVIIPEDTGQGSGNHTAINPLSDKLSGFSAYPTLMANNITLAFDLKEMSNVSATLVSIGGQQVKAFMSQEPVGEGAFKRSYDVGGLATGVYLLTLQIGNESIVAKVVKE